MFVLTEHAKEVLKERKIAHSWVERVLSEPVAIQKDPTDPTMEHRFGRVKEYGNRVLRVVLDKEATP